MKRCSAVLFTLLMLVCLLTACAEETLVGTWNTTIEGQPGQLILHADGTGQVVSHDAPRQCTWTVENNRLTVTQNVAGFSHVFLDRVTYELDGDTLTVVSQSGNTLVFEKP